jgi:hypothetical protein
MRNLLFLIAIAPLAFAADPKPDLTEAEAQQVIQKFAAKESEFALARELYTYRQTVKITEVDGGGKYELVSDIIFSSNGKRTEKIVRAPNVTLRQITLTPEDEQDLRSVQPFVLTTKDIDQYFVRYLGRETLDEVSCYSFSVKPKKLEQGKRYFQGTIWVDDRDLQIVKSYGRATGLLKKGSDNQFAKFETFREQIDGKYWFPTYTTASDTLNFQSGPVRIKMSVRYEDYKLFKSETKITFGDAVDNTPSQTIQKAPPLPPKK